MASVASNRAVSATVLLSLLVTGWCVAMASAFPVANGRRLQQFADSGGLASQLVPLTDGLQELSVQLKSALQTVSDLPADLHAQLDQVANSFELAQSELQYAVRRLLGLPASVLGQTDENIVKNLLTELKTKLEEILALFQNPQPDADGCFKAQQAYVLTAMSDLTSKLESATGGLPIPMQPQTLITALENLGIAVRQVDPCAAGLESLRSSKGPEVLATLEKLLGAFY